MSRIFVTSDPHYMHKNIAGPKVSAWKEGFRDFNNEKEMSQHIVKVWNQTVAEDDVLYCLGDWAFSGIENIWNFRKQLRCKTIHLVLGNHDHHIRSDNKVLEIPLSDKELLIKLELFDDFHEAFDERWLVVPPKDLFTSVQDVLTFKACGRTFFCSHYAHRVWEGSHKGILHLYGHSHGSIADFGKSMDVGVDVARRLLGDYRPFNLETELLPILEAKQIEFPDHHNKNTNIR